MKFDRSQWYWLFAFAGVIACLPASAGDFGGRFEFQVIAWEADCPSDPAAACGVARELYPGSSAQLEIAVGRTDGPGSAARASGQLRFPADDEKAGLRVTIEIFSVEPQQSSGQVPYLQLKVGASGRLRFTCAESVRWRSPMELPPLICGGMDPASPTSQIGLTVVPKWLPQ